MVSPESISGLETATAAGVVCLCAAGQSGRDAGGDEHSGTGRTGVSSVVGDVVSAEVDCPVFAVGERVDVAAAYDAGAFDVVPLDFTEHAGTVVDKVAQALSRTQNERLLSGVVDEAADGILLHDPDTGEILASNDRFYGMLGMDPATRDLTLEDITGHDSEFTRDRAVSLVRQAADGTPTTFEWRDPTNEGRDIWVEVKLESARLAGREYVVAAVRDIEQRKERERELQESRARLRRLHEITADPEMDLDERVQELLAFGASALDMSVGFLSRIDEAAGDFEVVEAAGDHPLIQAGAESDLGETYCRKVVEGESLVAIDDAETAGMTDDPAYEKFGLGCYLGAEIVVDGDRYGTLCFADESPRREPFSETEQALIDHMAQWLRQELQQREYVREIRASQEREQRVIERVDDAFFALDTEWRVQYVNDAGAAVLRDAMDAEYARDDLIGRHLWEEIPDAVETAFYDRYHEALDEQRSVSFEEYYEPLDVWFDVRAYPDEDGLSVYFTDVTERKEREQELERYETILESLDDAVYAIEADGTFTYVNRQYASMKGVDRERLLGTNIYDWVDDETAARADAVRRQVEDGERDVGVLEYEFQSVDGETTPVEMRFAPVGEPGGSNRRVGVIRDISERRERERELYIKQRALEEASIPLTLSDPSKEDNPLVYVNKSFEELTGYDATTATGRNCRFLQGPDTDQETVDEIRAKIEAEEDVSTEIRNYRADGSEFWNWLSVTPIYDEDGTLLRYLGSQRDVSDRRRNRRIRKELLSTTNKLLNAESRERLAEIISEATASVLGYDLNAVYLRSDEPQDSQLTAVAWPDRIERLYDGALSPDPAGPVREAFETGEPVIWTATDDERAGVTERYNPVSSMLVLPLGDHGVLAVGSTDRGTFGEAEKNRARLLTVNATTAFDQVERRQELERYETVFETVRDKLYVIDNDGYIEMVSQPLAEAAGYDADELRGHHVSKVLTEETVDDGDARILDLLVTPDAVSSTYEGVLTCRDGERVPVEIELSLLPYDDRFQGTVGAVRDISERREREEELRVVRRALDEAGIGLVMYNGAGRFEYVNDHYARLLGRTRDDIEGAHVRETFGELEQETFSAYRESFILGETRTDETEHYRGDGSTVPVETVTTAVEVDGTEHHIQTVRKITERRERRQQTEVLQRLIRHNLRNDLTVILGHSEMLAETLDGTNAGAAETINGAASRLQGLTATARRAQEIIGREIVRKPVDVVPLLEDEISRLQSESEVTVETDLPETRFILADTPLRQAFRQLLTNAVEHNDSARPTLWVRIRAATDRAGWVDIEIADDGPGIPDHEVATLTAGEETSLQHSSGIGLWIIKWVVTRYGGDLEFETRDRGGSLVRIKLPVADRQAEATVDKSSADVDR
ncbi:PAS domain S-box protein [Haloarcula brevis]|uniref:PAS domain S-box protein n=1 Tax=Haloarcula brevis TaxID=3111453 RepID=UPI00300EFDE7